MGALLERVIGLERLVVEQGALLRLVYDRVMERSAEEAIGVRPELRFMPEKTAAEEAEDAALRERIRAMRAGEVPNRGDGDWVPEGRVTSAELLRRLGDK